MGSGCGSVGRAVGSDTKDPRFKPPHRQSFIYQIFYQLYHRKDEIKEKEAGNGTLKKVSVLMQLLESSLEEQEALGLIPALTKHFFSHRV